MFHVFLYEIYIVYYMQVLYNILIEMYLRLYSVKMTGKSNLNCKNLFHECASVENKFFIHSLFIKIKIRYWCLTWEEKRKEEVIYQFHIYIFRQITSIYLSKCISWNVHTNLYSNKFYCVILMFWDRLKKKKNYSQIWLKCSQFIHNPA